LFCEGGRGRGFYPGALVLGGFCPGGLCPTPAAAEWSLRSVASHVYADSPLPEPTLIKSTFLVGSAGLLAV